MPYLRLVRLPNVLTALTDVLAGYVIVRALEGPRALLRPQWGVLLALLAVSACLYAAGAVFNDCFDYEEDRLRRPERPLPSGAISLRGAFGLGALLVLVAVYLAMAVGEVTVWVTTFLVLAIFLYNGRAKRFVVPGALAMGACRMLSMHLGMSAGRAYLLQLHTPGVLLPPIFLGLYAALITLTSGLEEEAEPAAPIEARHGPAATVLGAAAAGFAVVIFSLAITTLEWWPGHLLAVLLMGALCVRLWGALHAHERRSRVRAFTGAAVLGVIVLDAAIILGQPAGPRHEYAGALAAWGVAALALLAPAYLLSRRMSVS